MGATTWSFEPLCHSRETSKNSKSASLEVHLVLKVYAIDPGLAANGLIETTIDATTEHTPSVFCAHGNVQEHT
jgi:hypothetical protein